MRISFSDEEQAFLSTMEECRIATCHSSIPHVKPASFVFYNKSLYVATDYSTRSFKNLQKNPKIAIVVDKYQPGNHKAICVQGNAIILENGKKFLEVYNVFYEKFEWVRNEPWKENEAPIILVDPIGKSSWGLK